MTLTVAVYTCHYGYVFTGGGRVRSRVCLPGGVWSGGPLACHREYTDSIILNVGYNGGRSRRGGVVHWLLSEYTDSTTSVGYNNIFISYSGYMYMQ